MKPPPPPPPLAFFRVYGWRSSLYFRVLVWRTKKEMIAYRRAEGLLITDMQAAVLTFEARRSSGKNIGRITPCCGEFHFCLRGLTMEAISHESFHAACEILRRVRFNFADLANGSTRRRVFHNEEVAALMVGRLAQSIVNRLARLGLIEQHSTLIEKLSTQKKIKMLRI